VSRRLPSLLFAAIAVVVARSAVIAIVHAGQHPSGREVLVALYYVLRTGVALAFAAFTLNRAEPHRRSRDPLSLVACATAMLAVLAFRPPAGSDATAPLLVGDALAVLSCAWLLASVLALGRCFGVLPEARGLVTSGAYRHVRHPVYLGELGACVGLAIASVSLVNALVLAVFVAAQTVRMQLEERALTRAFPEYAAYAARTPRIIPRLPRPAAPRPRRRWSTV
jgi:protein-S-isoprenylcysteine O-methyltransferase Ste14